MNTTTQLRCTYVTYARGARHRCYNPVADDGMVVKDIRWGIGTERTIRYLPLCGQHVGAERRKRYGQRELLVIDAEIRAAIDKELAEEAAAKAEQRAHEKAVMEERAQVWAQREAEASAVEYNVVRKDEGGRIIGWATETHSPVVGPSVPRWILEPTTEYRRSYGQIEVKVVEEYGQRRLEFRNVNALTPNEAVALAWAIGLALQEEC